MNNEITVDGKVYVLKEDKLKQELEQKREDTSSVVRRFLGDDLFDYLKSKKAKLTTDGIHTNSWEGSHYYTFDFSGPKFRIHQECDVAEIGESYLKDFKNDAYILFAFSKKVADYLFQQIKP